MLLPQSGMGMQDGEIQSWLKREGDSVSQGEVIVEVEAAKALVEIEAPCDGILDSIGALEGPLCDDQRLYPQAGGELNVLDGVDIGGIGHCHLYRTVTDRDSR